MAHIYSVEIHDYLSRAIQTAQQDLRDARERQDNLSASYLQGRLQELLHFRTYLSKRIDLKTQDYY